MKHTKIINLIFAGLFAAAVLWSSPALACSAGNKADVLWKGSWYPAHVLKGKGDQCFIHYDGYNNSWDEWVGPSRYRMP